METSLLIALFFPLLFSPFFLLFERIFPKHLGFLASLAPLVSSIFLYQLGKASYWSTPSVISLPWIPILNVSFTFLIDGLSLFFGFLITLIGILVCIYSQATMTHRKRHLGRFYLLLLFFMSTMLGTVFSENILLLFIFWELTGIASFLLIGFHYEEAKAIDGAKTALLVTSFTSLALLVGFIFLGFLAETYSWTTIVQRLDIIHSFPIWLDLSFLLIAIGIFGKSAQFPFFFWLPQAMVAPTPVSAYLHAATMVKLGIYLTARIYPLFVGTGLWFPIITSFCFATMLLGAFLSLLSNDLKAILAYATVSQLGFFIGFYGMGGIEGVQYDFIHILNHALYKGSLFMLVGIVDHATGIRDIRDLGNLWRKMPLTAAIFFVATAAMAGIPGSTGFLSKELFLADILSFGRENPIGWVILAVVGFASIFKVAFSIRLFLHIFIRPRTHGPELYFQPPSLLSQISPFILSAAALYFGFFPNTLNFLLERFFVSGLHTSTETQRIVYNHVWEIFISFFILGLGVLLFYIAEKTNWRWTQIPKFLQFDRLFDQINRKIQSTANWITNKTVFRRTDDALLLYTATVILLVGGFSSQHVLPFIASGSTPLVPIAFTSFFRWTTTFFTVIATFTILFLQTGIAELIALSTTGFFITLYYVLYQAPDLAMTQLLIEVAILFFVVFFMKTFPAQIFEPRVASFRDKAKRWLAVAVGVWAAFLSSLTTFHPISERLGNFFLNEAVPMAHGTNAVNAILIDFRGLDTLGEITVLVLAILGVFGFWNGKIQQSKTDSIRERG